MIMKAHTYYIIFGRPLIGGKLPPSPLAAPLTLCRYVCMHVTIFSLTTLQLTRLTASSLLPRAPRTHSALRRRSSVCLSVCLSQRRRRQRIVLCWKSIAKTHRSSGTPVGFPLSTCPMSAGNRRSPTLKRKRTGGLVFRPDSTTTDKFSSVSPQYFCVF